MNIEFTPTDRLITPETPEPVAGKIDKVVESWTDSLRLTEEDIQRQLYRGTRTFNEKKIEKSDPEADPNFWIKNGVRSWEKDLTGLVSGKMGPYGQRSGIRVSSELARSAGKKLYGKEGEKFEEGFKNLSEAEKVSMMALTKAKIQAVRNMAEDVYPALKRDFDEQEKQIDKVLTDLLVDKKSLQDIRGKFDLSRIMPSGRMAVPTVLAIAGVVMSACTTEAQPTITPTETSTQPTATEVSPIPSKTPTELPTETAAPTEMPTETATPTEISEVLPDLTIVYKEDGSIDRTKIPEVNIVPTEKEQRENYFAFIKSEALKTPGMDLRRGAMGVNPDGSGYISLGTLEGGNILPSALSKDVDGNVVISFLGYFKNMKNEWAPELINLKLIPEEMESFYTLSERGTPDEIWTIDWSKRKGFDIFFILTSGDYNKPAMSAQAENNEAEGITYQIYYDKASYKIELNIDGVVFPAMIVDPMFGE